MPIQPADLIIIAKNLASSEFGEVGARSAVSRAYYGALHTCFDALPTEFQPDESDLKREGSHRAIIDAMARWGKAIGAGRGDAQQAARKISQLKRHRVVADYVLSDEWRLEATMCIAVAEEIIGSVSRARAKRDSQS